jgi:hypothetical protein
LIHESRYWKIPLLRGATFLERAVVTEENGEATLARAERELFIGFYSIRKLLPTFKLSNNTKRLSSKVSWYASRPEQSVDYFHRSDVDELYDLERPIEEMRDLGFMCNQVIHSYVFVNSTTEDGKLDGFFVSSDTMRRRRVYFFSLPVVLHAFRTVGRDYPKGGRYLFNEVNGEWEASPSDP